MVTAKHERDPQAQPQRRKSRAGSQQKHCPQDPAVYLPAAFSAFPRFTSRVLASPGITLSYPLQPSGTLILQSVSMRKQSKQA